MTVPARRPALSRSRSRSAGSAFSCWSTSNPSFGLGAKEAVIAVPDWFSQRYLHNLNNLSVGLSGHEHLVMLSAIPSVWLFSHRLVRVVHHIRRLLQSALDGGWRVL